MLRVEALRTGYGSAEILHGVDLHVEPGEAVAVLGPNGAGKTTLLRAISGLIRVFGGSVLFLDKPINRIAPEIRTRMGLVHVPEGRGMLRSLSVHESLVLAELAGRQRRGPGSWTIDGVLDIFPVLRVMRTRPCANLSGGQQQMLAIARGLLAQPRVFMLDEPSFGLAPVIVKNIYQVLGELGKQGTTMVIVEQNAAVLELASRVYVLRNGRIVLNSEGSALPSRESLLAAYVGSA
jgi:branched-chain amino acid transport system ATP-binding protein